METINTDWDGIPHVDKNAAIRTHRKVTGVLALRVVDASIRDAVVTDIFELAEVPKPLDISNGKLKAEVKCLWYERKPSTTWMHLTLSHEWEIIKNFTGNVAANIE